MKDNEHAIVSKWFYEFEDLARKLRLDSNLKSSISSAGSILSLAVRSGGKVLIFGNGGSAAEAQHFSAELVCRFRKDRRAIASIALTTDTSIITAQSNDSGFDSTFSRQIEALCRPGDVVIGLTTSDVGQDGHSKNIENAFRAAKDKGARTIGLFSERTKNLLPFVETAIVAPHSDTARVQEAHLTIIHLLCELIEETL